MLPICHICKLAISRLSSSLSCSICFSCYRSICLDISIETFKVYNKPSNSWICHKHSTNMSTTPTTSYSHIITKQNKKPSTIDDLAKLINTLSTNQNKSFESINIRINDIKKHLSNLDLALAECNKLNA